MFSSDATCPTSPSASEMEEDHDSKLVFIGHKTNCENDVGSNAYGLSKNLVSSQSDEEAENRNELVFDYFDENSPSSKFQRALLYDQIHITEPDCDRISPLSSVRTPQSAEFQFSLQTRSNAELQKEEINRRERQKNTMSSDEVHTCDSDSGDENLVDDEASRGHKTYVTNGPHDELLRNTILCASNPKDVHSGVSFPSGYQPPFNDPLDVKKLNRSICKLIPNNRDNRRCAYKSANLPPADQVGSQEDNDKKKKKKRKEKKDDGGEDENGNPVVYSHGHKASQMVSQFPKNQQELVTVVSGGGKDNGEGTMPSNPHKKSKRKNKEVETKKAEEIPGHVGDKPVEELISYIDGSSNGSITASGSHGKVHASGSAGNRIGRDKSAGVMASQNSASLHQDHSIQSKTETKTKKKRKNKSGSSSVAKTFSEVDEKSPRGSEGEGDGDKIKEKFGEDGTNCDVTDSIDIIPSNQASSSPTGEESAASHDSHFDSVEDDMHLLVSCKEEQFTLVNKSKKKRKYQLSKEISSKDVVDYTKEDVPSRRHSSLRTRSSTPPPSTLVSSKQDRSSERALSPSSFPVLGKPRETRRNSTGNLAELERSYESDHESVKSVPPSATADGNKSGMDNLAASYKPPSISYATIAAGKRSFLQNNGASSQDGDKPLPKTNNKPTDKISSGISRQLLSQAVAEGTDAQSASTTARGTFCKSSNSSSRPSSASNSAKVKPSQPAITAQSTLKPTTSSDGAVGTTFNTSTSVNSSSTIPEPVSSTSGMSDECPCQVGEQSGEKATRGQTSKDEVLNVNNATDFPALPHLNPAKQLDQLVGKDAPASASAPSPESLQAQPGAQMSSNKVLPSRSLDTTTGVEVRNISSKPPVAPTRNTSVKSKSKASTKSVIFMDRKTDDLPVLDISFGFEPNFENNIIPVGIESSSTCSSDSGRGTDNDSISTHLAFDKDGDNHGVTDGFMHNLNHRTTNMTIKTSTSYASNKAEDGRGVLLNVTCAGQLVFMGPEQPEPGNRPVNKVVEPPNGIISSLAQSCIQHSPTVGSLVTDNHIIIASNDSKHSRQDGMSEGGHSETRQGAADETKDRSQKCVFSYIRDKDPNFQPGSFDHLAGVVFLYTEWQKLQDTVQKYNPSGSIIS